MLTPTYSHCVSNLKHVIGTFPVKNNTGKSTRLRVFGTSPIEILQGVLEEQQFLGAGGLLCDSEGREIMVDVMNFTMKSWWIGSSP